VWGAEFTPPPTLFLCLVLATPAPAADLPVRGVTLSSAGIAQIERAGELQPQDSASFRAPLGDVDDVLRSLVVMDPAGAVEGLRLPARDLAEEAFRGLPLRPDDFASRVALLAALRGQEAEAANVRGRIADATEVEHGLRLSLITPTGLTTVLLREGDEIRLTDTALAARVARAAEALAAARAAEERRIEIALRADRAREVALLYVAGAPIWKPSYRLLVPATDATDAEARLQGWAVVENASGSDWDRIRLALVSGETAAYRQPIYAPIAVDRPVVPVRVAEAVRVRPDTGDRPVPPPPPVAAPMVMAPAPAARAEMGARERAAGGAMAQQPPAQPAAAAQAEASAGRVAFRLPQPVTIRSGETADVPFLDARLPAQRIWWLQDLNARHPLSAVRIRNSTDTVLPDGLATIYGTAGAEAGAFLGDAEIRAMPVGDSRILAFARDREVQITAASSSTDRVTGILPRRGFISVMLNRQEESAFAVDPRGARGLLAIDLPRRSGATPRFAVAAEGDFGLRHEAALQGAPQTIRLVWDRAMRQDIPLWDQGLGDPALLRWQQFDIEQNQRRLPGGPGTVERLQEILERMPQDAPGRAELAGTIAAMNELRRLLDTARDRARSSRSAELVLQRARQAAEDRTGPELQDARRKLNEASRAAEAAGAAADQAWEAWQRAVMALLQRGT